MNVLEKSIPLLIQAYYEEHSKLAPPSSSMTHYAMTQFLQQFPDVKTKKGLYKGTYLVKADDYDILLGFLKAKGEIRKNKTRCSKNKSEAEISPATTSSPLEPVNCKSLIASMVRSAKQLRSMGYQVTLAIQEPAKEY